MNIYYKFYDRESVHYFHWFLTYAFYQKGIKNCYTLKVVM